MGVAFAIVTLIIILGIYARYHLIKEAEIDMNTAPYSFLLKKLEGGYWRATLHKNGALLCSSESKSKMEAVGVALQRHLEEEVAEGMAKMEEVVGDVEEES